MNIVDENRESNQPQRDAIVTTIVVQDLALENLLLGERVASLEADVDVYRCLLSESLTQNVRLAAQLDSSRQQAKRWRASYEEAASDPREPRTSVTDHSAAAVLVQ